MKIAPCLRDWAAPGDVVVLQALESDTRTALDELLGAGSRESPDG